MGEWKETVIGKIPRDWKLERFSEILEVNGRVGWKGYKTSDLRDNGPVVLGGVNIKSNLQLDFSNLTHLSREKYDESPEIILEKGDIILVTRGNGLADVGYYQGEFEEATINPTVVILTRFKGESKFLFYYLMSRQGRHQVLSVESGSSIPALYQGEIKKLFCPIPQLKEQKAIASILSSLDEKIDLLHRQNETLEGMAEVLFREWFVEKEWNKGILSDLGRIVTGKTPSTKNSDFWKGDLPFVTPTDFKNFGKFVTSTNRYLSNVSKKKFENLIIPKDSIVVTCIGSDMGKVAVTQRDCITNQQINSIVIEHDFIGKEFIYQFLKSIYSLLRSLALGGTTMPIINKSLFSSIEIPVPHKQKVLEFNVIAKKWDDKIQKNTNQIQTLENLRDTLLPKLMSGEVRVRY